MKQSDDPRFNLRRPFRVLLDHGERKAVPDCPREVPWGLLAPHEDMALVNHDQSLERLHERGGLSPHEMLAIIKAQSLRKMLREKKPLAVAVTELSELVREYLGRTP